MNQATYTIRPLPTEVVERARAAARAGPADHALVTTDVPESYPCRHCLRWAQPGEVLVLFPFASIAAGRPYSDCGPIFVHAESCERYRALHEFPRDFREGRSIRGYDAAETMIAAKSSTEARRKRSSNNCWRTRRSRFCRSAARVAVATLLESSAYESDGTSSA